jgi:hypothetical protein
MVYRPQADLNSGLWLADTPPFLYIVINLVSYRSAVLVRMYQVFAGGRVCF